MNYNNAHLIFSHRFPGFSKTPNPELYLLTKHIAKGNDTLPIYVSYLTLSCDLIPCLMSD